MAAITASAAAVEQDRLRPVRIWLYAIAALVLLMVAIGGITRLTGSGLSITEWKPITGTIPPLTEADWLAEFEAYKQIPQYTELNRGMSLDQFRFIFWWEWAHRFLGRVIGLAFAVPFLVFLIQRRFSWRLALPLGGLFVLGGFQGALGWWMVSSGLSELTSVSQYRLAAHLVAAAVLFVALVWVARRLSQAPAAVPRARPWTIVVLLVLVLLQIAAGGFVAGLDAGLAYDTWPLMGGQLVPTALGDLDPWWRDLFENVATVQFVHRTMAYLIVLYVGTLWLLGRGAAPARHTESWLSLIAVLVGVQVALGVATLLAGVPIWLALAHQSLAFMLAGVIAAYLADFYAAVS